jgi:hypothetical protein
MLRKTEYDSRLRLHAKDDMLTIPYQPLQLALAPPASANRRIVGDHMNTHTLDDRFDTNALKHSALPASQLS